tara:strand:+ start:619 stop:792 length:174 start_codon:yes stop_codon:yes gene_type:complete
MYLRQEPKHNNNNTNLEKSINNLSKNINTIHDILGDILLKIKIMEKEIQEIKRIITN